jgi:hypothetical protein
MDLLQTDYLHRLNHIAEENLKPDFKFSELGFSAFQIINASLFKQLFSKEDTNLLISIPTNELPKTIIEISILLPVLKCFLYNASISKSVTVGDIIIKAECGTISSIKDITDENLQVLPMLTLKRVKVNIGHSFLTLNEKIKLKVTEIQGRATFVQKQKGLENLKSKLLEEIQQHVAITKYYQDGNVSLPTKHKTKVIAVASKKDILELIPSCIPFQYINKSGEIYPDTPFDPILYVVNDFATAKEFVIDKDIEIDAILFIGDNKYKSTTAITRLYRQEKFKRCIFIGNEDVENTDKFKVLKWNWTLPETKYFSNETNSKINTIKISHPELSNAILEFIKIIDKAEKQNENLINLKKSLRFIRRIYPTAALNNERIKSRANDIFEEFEKEVEELFQDEYQSIDKDYKPDFKLLKNQFKNIIALVKNDNAKARWFKEQAQNVDYIVVPKVIKAFWQKEIEKCVQTQQPIAKVKSLADLNNIQHKEQVLQFYNCLKSAQVLTLKEFEQKEADDKRYLFLSFYGNGVYPETLLEKMYAKNVVSNILLYEEEYKAFQYHLYKFNDRTIKEFRSADREELSGIKFPETQNVNTENIDEWIKFLIDSENFKFSKKEEIRYEITFVEDTKKIKQRESKNVYVEGYNEHHKEIRELKKGDKVRIYQNPDIEILHDIIKMTDDKELFSRVDKFSSLWKNALWEYASSTAILKKYEEIIRLKHSSDYDKLSIEDKKQMNNKEEALMNIIVNESSAKSINYIIDNLFEELVSNGLSVSKNQLENWLHPDNKTKFPKRKIDFSAIVKTINNEELNNNWKFIMETNKEYLGTLNHKGRKFADEIDNYILTKEKGEMLDWLSENHIEKIIRDGAPLRTIKEIQKLDYEITD